MLKSRAAQTGVLVGAMGITFGMILAPVPEAASEYVLESVLEDMQFHQDQHQSAVEGFKITTRGGDPHFLVREFRIQNAVTNPEDCENDEGHRFQFESSILDDGLCVGPGEYQSPYMGYAAYRAPSTVDTPPRISFYVKNEQQNSMYIEIGDDNS